jgi:hypothetical protein
MMNYILIERDAEAATSGCGGGRFRLEIEIRTNRGSVRPPRRRVPAAVGANRVGEGVGLPLRLAFDAAGRSWCALPDLARGNRAEGSRFSSNRRVRLDRADFIRGQAAGGWARWVRPTARVVVARLDFAMRRLITVWEQRRDAARRVRSGLRTTMSPRSPTPRQSTTRRSTGCSKTWRPNSESGRPRFS